MFISNKWREDRLAHSLPQKYGKYLLPRHSLSFQQVQQLCFQPNFFTYEVLLTIDPKKLSHITDLNSITKVNIISNFLEQFQYNIYGLFEAPLERPTNLHFHGVIAIKHDNYDKMLKALKQHFLKKYAKTIGMYTIIRINSSTESYKPTDSISGFKAKRTIGNFNKYYNYMNKSLTDNNNIYHNTHVQRNAPISAYNTS